MKFIENPLIGNMPDLMTYLSLTQAGAAMYDETISFYDKQIIDAKTIYTSAAFCNAAIKLQDSGYILTPSMCTIGEPDSRDGVYIYCISKDKPRPKRPEPDQRIDGAICIYGSLDLSNPVVEYYYGDTLLGKVEILVDGNQAIPHQTMCDKESLTSDEMCEAYDIINQGILDGIAQVKINQIRGFQYGMDAAQSMFE